MSDPGQISPVVRMYIEVCVGPMTNNWCHYNSIISPQEVFLVIIWFALRQVDNLLGCEHFLRRNVAAGQVRG